MVSVKVGVRVSVGVGITDIVLLQNTLYVYLYKCLSQPALSTSACWRPGIY